MHLYGDEQNVQGRGLLGGGQGLPLTLQLGHLHPLPVEEGVEALHLPDGDQDYVAVPVFDGLVIDPAQVVCAQEILQRR